MQDEAMGVSDAMCPQCGQSLEVRRSLLHPFHYCPYCHTAQLSIPVPDAD